MAFTQTECRSLLQEKIDEARGLREKMNQFLKEARDCQRRIAKIDATITVYREILDTFNSQPKG